MRADAFLHDLADGLRGELPAKLRKRDTPSWLLEFLEEHVPTDHGAYSLARHEPMRQIVQLLEHITIHRESESRVDVVKAEQVGFTTFALGFALWLVAEQGYNVGYFLPDKDFASEFGMVKLNPIVEGSEYLTSLMEDAVVDRGVLKQLGEKFLYLLGLSTIKGATYRPMDWQLSDEVDLTSEKIRKWKSGRMAASKMRAELDFSAPYAEDSGIDARYKAGSQSKWLVKCVACGKDEIVLEEILDLTECFRNFSGTWVRVCPQCHRKLDVTKNGRWVAAQPERERERHYSFRLSAMACEAISADFIMKQYLEAQDDAEALAIFDRTRRGIANAGAMQPFTREKLREMERDYVLQYAKTGNPTFIGGDVGNACWFWVEEWLPEGRPRLIWAEKVSSERYKDRALELIKKFDPQFAVIDKMPLFDESRKIAYAHPLRVALQQFQNGLEPDIVEERLRVEELVGSARVSTGPAYQCVKGDRDLILGGFANEATRVDRGLLIPRQSAGEPPIMALVREHLRNLRKEPSKDRTGNEHHHFLDNVENHLGMAAASARMARLFAPGNTKCVARAVARKVTVGDALMPRPKSGRRNWGLMRRV
ncbi:MAG: phage terminase large subunit family protein [Thermoanaerobaculia bacterium]